jgi:amino acid transporter
VSASTHRSTIDVSGSTSRKALDGKALFSVSIGVIVCQLGMVALLHGIGIGGLGFVVAMAIALAIAMANAMAYAEMALMMPSARSLGSYAEAAIGTFPAILLVFAGYVTPALVGLPGELILVEQTLREAIGISLPVGIWAVSLVALFTGLNILGTDVFAKVQTALTFTVLSFLIVAGLVTLSGGAVRPVDGGMAHSVAELGANTVTLAVVGLAFWAFVGSEFVTALVPDARDANRDLPRAMIGGLLAIFAAQLLFVVGAGVLVPRETLVDAGTPHLAYAVAVFGPSARFWFAALALIASASLLNTVIASVSRMLYGMAEEGQVLAIFKRLHPRFGTPIYAIVFVGALPLIGLIWSRADVNELLPLTIAASTSWLLAYVVAQISLVVLRWRNPRTMRPFKVSGYPWVPLFALAGMAYVALHSSPDPAMTPRIERYTGIMLGVFALFGALWVKLVMKKGLFEPTMPQARQAPFAATPSGSP